MSQGDRFNKFTPQEIVAFKRDGLELDDQTIQDLVNGITNESIGDAQVGALAMAIILRGMTLRETVQLTGSMCRSGSVLKWDVNGPVVDKHSTGGIGDTVSLMLAPMLASLGAFVPMISGRGLGHSGGTCDKMEAIPEYSTSPDRQQFQAVVAKVGCAIIGQTDDFAPADRRLYKIRDVTATVESIPLICSSILSKKLAAGIEVLVMDVKTGNGAFMTTLEKSRELASTIETVATGNHMKCRSLITDMNQPLCSAAGNGLEVLLAIDYLKGSQEPRLHQVVLELGATILFEAGLTQSLESGRLALQETLDNGKAIETFSKMVAMLGGPTSLIDNPRLHIARAPIVRDIVADASGYVFSIDTRSIGMSVVQLGGGRTTPGAPIDPRVGITHLTQVGQKVVTGQLIATVHAGSEASAELAGKKIQRAITISNEAPEIRPTIFL